MAMQEVELAEDLVLGAANIATLMLKDGNVRTIYHWAATTNIPIFHLGGQLALRRSVLFRWIESLENRGRNLPSPSNEAAAKMRSSSEMR
ncbi:MAG TPA: hypothetical protein VKX28_11225 [Xanthobacteraceae bacterium]|nr:hypothetical protein [Xanthobacteraceae bacterium]